MHELNTIYRQYIDARTIEDDNTDEAIWFANELADDLLAGVDNDAWKFNFVIACAKREIAAYFA